MTDLQQTINQEYDAAAEQYETQPGHDISPAEANDWLADLGGDLKHSANHADQPPKTLDVGAGTGVFSRFLAAQGHQVLGLEPSLAMLQEAEKHTPASFDVVYQQGGDSDLASLPPNHFDFICARQAACYFADPVASFRQCHALLRPHGRIVVIEGIWSRAGWGDSDLIDQLPLSCVQTRQTLAYLLTLAGFRVTRNDWLTAVNQHHDQPNGTNGSRYVVVGEKG